MPASIRCPECRKWDLEVSGPEGEVVCSCERKRHFEIELFPAILKKAEVAQAENALEDTEATCLYHPHKRAVAICESCGAFICELCVTRVNGFTQCLNCYARGVEKAKGKSKDKDSAHSFQQVNILWDNHALALATIPMLIFYFTIITGPISVYLALRHWNDHPTSLIVPRSRWRYIVALFFGGIQTLAWGYLIIALIWGTL